MTVRVGTVPMMAILPQAAEVAGEEPTPEPYNQGGNWRVGRWRIEISPGEGR